MYILCGLPFTGKTTLAEHLAEHLGITRIDLDAINLERGLGPNAGAISPQEWDATYIRSYKWLEELLDRGSSVIYDATNFTRAQRDQLRAIAQHYRAKTSVIYVNVPTYEARNRWQMNRVTGARYDVRDEDFAQVVDNFEAPDEERDMIEYNQSLPNRELGVADLQLTGFTVSP